MSLDDYCNSIWTGCPQKSQVSEFRKVYFLNKFRQSRPVKFQVRVIVSNFTIYIHECSVCRPLDTRHTSTRQSTLSPTQSSILGVTTATDAIMRFLNSLRVVESRDTQILFFTKGKKNHKRLLGPVTYWQPTVQSEIRQFGHHLIKNRPRVR